MNKAEFNKVVQKMIAKHYLMNSNIENANAIINVFTESVIEALKDNDEILLVGFGRFSKRKVAARKGRNPRTGETMDIPTYF
jgi:DNA-binding protein HU-beta